jgi:hypothetical protein
MGCSSSFGGGEPLATSPCGVRMRGEGRSFAPGGSAHAAYCHRFNPLSAQPAAGSRRCPQASSRRAVAVGVQLSGVLATPGSERRRGSRGSLPARPERGGLTHTVFPAKGSAESEGERGGRAAPKGLGVHGGRESDARGMCPCVVVVLLQKSQGGVGLREACGFHFTRFGDRTGTGV